MTQNRENQFKETKICEVILILADASVECASVASLSEEQIDNAIRTTLNYSNDSRAMITISEAYGTPRSQGKLVGYMRNVLKQKLQSKSNRTWSTCCSLAKMPYWTKPRWTSPELWTRKKSKNLMSRCFERWLQSETFENGFVKKIVSIPHFIQPVEVFIC